MALTLPHTLILPGDIRLTISAVLLSALGRFSLSMVCVVDKDLLMQFGRLAYKVDASRPDVKRTLLLETPKAMRILRTGEEERLVLMTAMKEIELTTIRATVKHPAVSSIVHIAAFA